MLKLFHKKKGEPYFENLFYGFTDFIEFLLHS